MIRRVLLVCTGNTCRSPMAEGLLKRLWQQAVPGWDLEVSSAGTGAMEGDTATDHAVSVMQEYAYDLSGHRSRVASDAILDQADLILTMTTRHKQHLLLLRPDLHARVFTLGEYSGSHREVADPYGGGLADYKTTAQALETVLQAVIERIRSEGAEPQ